jgi:hypothetical protein
MRNAFRALALSGIALLSACGDTALEQGVTGAAGGAIAGEALFDDALTGAAIGAAGSVAYCQRFPERC